MPEATELYRPFAALPFMFALSHSVQQECPSIARAGGIQTLHVLCSQTSCFDVVVWASQRTYPARKAQYTLATKLNS